VIAQPDLERLVQDLAGRPEEWAHLIEHRADARTYASCAATSVWASG